MSQDHRPTARDMKPQTLPYPAKQSDMEIAPASDLLDYRPAGKLKGKAAVITGADSGIGRAVAIAFALEGAHVAIVYNENDSDADRTKQMIAERGGDCEVIKADVRSRDACFAAVKTAVDAVGGLNILVNNAAFQMAQTGGLEDISEGQLRRTFETNIFGYVFMAQAALPHLKAGDAIINTGSIVGMTGEKLLIDYAASKGAIHAFTRSLALSLGEKNIHAMTATPPPEITLKNKLKFLSLELLYACPPDADVLLYAMDNGLTRPEYEWFMRAEPPGFQVLGIDYYGRNERIITPDGRNLEVEDVLGWRHIATEYWRRFRKPIMHTETNVFDADAAPNWLWKQWVNVLDVRAAGIPVLGFTWYSLIDQVDWDIQLAEKRGKVNRCGLYNLDRQPNPVAAEFRQLLEAFGQITIMPHAEMLGVADRPAQLRVER